MIDTGPGPGPGPGPAEAAAKLVDAERIRAAVHRRGRWYVRYQLMYGLAYCAATLLLGMVATWWSSIVVAIGAFALGVVLLRRARRQPVAARVRDRCPEANVATAVSFPVYLAVCTVGFTFFERNPAWWLPGAVATAVPWFVHAYREARR